ncbi:MAG: prepilin-type N-terminal cleavage/methylation domain-containing protein [Candidatus Doudnabacteria bacterium]|nr:prepilin-type N-terminal cleavage/methylation domain-containing protein [Candidatus Doudnabacteria bacterium]
MRLKTLPENPGFTLIEILVVVSIIGLLASIAMVGLRNARTRALTTRVSADLVQIQKQIDVTRLRRNATVLQITGSGCSDCASRNTKVISNFANMATLQSSWRQLGFVDSPMDPWGTPYLIDENELEAGPSDCRYDSVWSAGPNGINNAGGADDVQTNITHFVCPN